MEKYATTTPITAVLNIPAGRIQVIAAHRSDAIVDVRPSNPGKKRDVKTAEKTPVEFADGVLRIGEADPKNQYFSATGSVEVTVQVPIGSHVEAHTSACELRGVGRLGDVTFEGAYKHIKIDEAVNLRLTAVDGDVEVGRLRGRGQISTARGSITVTEATKGAVVLNTHMGDITVGAASGVSASLDARTCHGRVTNALKNDGTVELDIRATTDMGNISARSV